MKLLLILLVFCIMGCNSLPSEIAFHAGQTSTTCGDAARKTFNALQSLKYPGVEYCQGWPWHGHSKCHAWVEYQDDAGDVRILDPYAILEEGIHEYWREDLAAWEYQKEMELAGIP